MASECGAAQPLIWVHSKMRSADRFIASCSSWDDFWERAKKLSNTEKGIAFERLTQIYLQTAPEYRTKLQNAWLLRDVPADIRQRLNLPGPDEGIDLIARTRNGEYWAIQSKFRSQRDKPLTRRELGTFSSLVSNTCNNIVLAVVAHTASKPVSKRHLMRHTVEIGLDRWQSLDAEAWILLIGRLKGETARPKPRIPKPHQRAAVFAAKAHFIRDNANRGRLIMPCGTGKSLTAHWIAEALGAKTVLVAVPSLALIRQSVTDWTREFLARNQIPDWLCVCSDETVGNLEHDEFVGEVYELGLPTHYKPNEILALLRAPSKGSKIVFTTYQSSDKLAAAARRARIKFDLAILDEAHKTVGVRSKQFATLLREKKIKVRHRLFMTATERVFRGNSDDVLSMDNEKDYGKCFFQMSYKEAISQGIISDYKILTMTVSDSRIRRLIAENHILNLNLRNLDEAEAQSAAAGIALKRVFKRHGIKHAISFHRSIRAADRFREQQDALNRLRDIGPRTTNLHISSKKTAGQRSDLLREFASHKRSLITNARCLTEGVDVPATDCVLFADPKQSRIDIVQAAGRALRRASGKKYGHILLPLVVPSKMDFSEFAETTAFRQIANTITALSIQDERIAEEFRAIEKVPVSTGKIVEIEGDVPVGMKVKLDDFAEAISTRLWQSVGRANWRPFDDARAFVRSVGLNSQFDWGAYCRSGKKPNDIPAAPEVTYSKDWVSWGDWLGTGTVSNLLRQFRSFKKARAFARSLRLKRAEEWFEYCASGGKPPDIPSNPNLHYAESGWVSYGDWLGTGAVSAHLRRYQPFKQARRFARELKLKSVVEWRKYLKAGKKPDDIPANPELVYATAGWSSWGDWLGTGRRRTGWRQFKEARAFVRRLSLQSGTEWFDYCKSGRKPDDIPTSPSAIYAKAGWAGIGDWLGTGIVANVLREYRSFKSSRVFVHKLGLKSHAEWVKYCKSGKKPADIPAKPATRYAKTGWKNWGDWLGTGRLANQHRKFRSFKKARVFARSLGLSSSKEWFEYCKGKRPSDIPSNPDKAYMKAGWVGYSDWLGIGKVSPGQHRSFKKAREFVRGLGLKSGTEWTAYCQSCKKPPDNPNAPQYVYANEGWSGIDDWLGTGKVRPDQYRSFEQARAFARSLDLKSRVDWSAYKKSGKKPGDIPAKPEHVYAKQGWSGYLDWFGAGKIRSPKFRSFIEARAFTQGLDLKSKTAWEGYCRSGKRPGDIPSNPQQVYAKTGWAGYSDWLGYARPRLSAET
jgi:superfamily II DNA or RNA helicase